MPTTRVVSNIYQSNNTIDSVYSFLSDFNRIAMLINMAKQMGSSNRDIAQMGEKIEKAEFTEDSCTLLIKGMGEIVIRIVEKEYPKLIKLGGEGSVPFKANLWIQLLENGPYDTRIKLTFEAEMNVMLKMMLKSKLTKGIEQLGEVLSKIPYAILK